MKTRSPFLNFISDYMFSRHYSIRTISAYVRWIALFIHAGVWMPHALAKKYPSANKSLLWQYLFPSFKLSADPETWEIRRHHFHPTCVRKAVKIAVKKSNITKLITPHTLRHSFIKCVHAFYPAGHPADVQI